MAALLRAAYIVKPYNGPLWLVDMERGKAGISPHTARLLSLFDVDPSQAYPLDFGLGGGGGGGRAMACDAQTVQSRPSLWYLQCRGQGVSPTSRMR